MGPVDMKRGGCMQRSGGWARAFARMVTILAGSLSGAAVADWDEGPCLTWPCGERQTYAVFDTLFLQRNNTSNNVPLVVDGDTLSTVLAAPTLQFATAPGVRAVVGDHGPQGVGWELGYVGVYGMFALSEAAGNNNLEVPPTLSSQVASLRNAAASRVSYGSTLNMAEANLLLTHHHVNRRRYSAYTWERIRRETTIDWIGGFRWAGLEEQAAIDLAPAGGRYGVRTTSNLFGGQIGLRGRTEWQQWALEGWIKAAVAGSNLSQSQDRIVDAVSGETYRTARSSQAGTAGGIFDVNATLVYRLTETWALRLGYNSYWLTGVALAPDQFDFSTSKLAGTTLDANKSLWLGGGSLGIEARW